MLITALLSGCNRLDTSKYISFTVTVEENKKLHSEVYYFDLSNEEVEKVAVLPYTSQYPLTVYDKKTNKVFYTSRIEEEHKDEVFEYAVDTKETKQITDDFFAINYIIPYLNKLLIAAVPLGDGVIHPYEYDRETTKISDLTWDSDIHISSLNINPDQNEFLAAGYSNSQLYENLEKQMTEEFKWPDYYLYDLKNNSAHDVLVKTEETKINTIAINNKYYYYSENGSEIIQIDRATKKESKLLTEDDNIEFNSIIYITDDNRTIYYIVGKQVNKYDIKAKEIKQIYADKRVRSKVNNAMILSDN